MVEYGREYFKSPLGILKILEIIFCIVVIVIQNEYFYGYSYGVMSTIIGAAAAGLVLSLLILILSVACGDKCDKVLEWQCFVHLVICICLLVAGIMLAVKNYTRNTMILAILGIIDGIIYLVDTIISYTEYKPF